MINKKFIEIIILIMLLILPGTPATLTHAAKNTIIHVPGDYPNLQEAIDNAPPGAIILLAPNYTSGPIMVPGWKNLTIKGSGSTSRIMGSDLPPVLLLSGGVLTISNLTIESNDLNMPAVSGYGSGLVLDNVSIMGSSLLLYSLGNSSLVLERVSVESEVFEPIIVGFHSIIIDNSYIVINRTSGTRSLMEAVNVGINDTVLGLPPDLSLEIKSSNIIISNIIIKINKNKNSVTNIIMSSPLIILENSMLESTSNTTLGIALDTVKTIIKNIDVDNGRIGFKILLHGNNTSLTISNTTISPTWREPYPNTPLFLANITGAGKAKIALNNLTYNTSLSLYQVFSASLINGVELKALISNIRISGSEIATASVSSIFRIGVYNGSSMDLDASNILFNISINSINKIALLLIEEDHTSKANVKVEDILLGRSIGRSLCLLETNSKNNKILNMNVSITNVTGLANTSISWMGPLYYTNLLPRKLIINNISGLSLLGLVMAVYEPGSGVHPYSYGIDSTSNINITNIRNITLATSLVYAVPAPGSVIYRTILADGLSRDAFIVVNQLFVGVGVNIIVRDVSVESLLGLVYLAYPVRGIEVSNATVGLFQTPVVSNGSVVGPSLLSALSTIMSLLIKNNSVNITGLSVVTVPSSFIWLSLSPYFDAEPLFSSSLFNLVLFKSIIFNNISINMSKYTGEPQGGATLAELWGYHVVMNRFNAVLPQEVRDHIEWNGINVKLYGFNDYNMIFIIKNSKIVNTTYLLSVNMNEMFKGNYSLNNIIINTTYIGLPMKPIVSLNGQEPRKGNIVIDRLIEEIPGKPQGIPRVKYQPGLYINIGDNIFINNSVINGSSIIISSPKINNLTIINTTLRSNPLRVLRPSGTIRIMGTLDSWSGETIIYGGRIQVVGFTIGPDSGTLLIINPESVLVHNITIKGMGSIWIIKANKTNIYFVNASNITTKWAGLHLIGAQHARVYLNNFPRSNNGWTPFTALFSQVSLDSEHPYLYRLPNGSCRVSLLGNYWGPIGVDRNGDLVLDTIQVLNLLGYPSIMYKPIDWYPLAVPYEDIRIIAGLGSPAHLLKLYFNNNILSYSFEVFMPGSLTLTVIIEGSPLKIQSYNTTRNYQLIVGSFNINSTNTNISLIAIFKTSRGNITFIKKYDISQGETITNESLYTEYNCTNITQHAPGHGGEQPPNTPNIVNTTRPPSGSSSISYPQASASRPGSIVGSRVGGGSSENKTIIASIFIIILSFIIGYYIGSKHNIKK